MIFLYVMIVLITLAIEIFFTLLGIKQCKENNIIGLIWLFIGLNFFGLVIGYVLLAKAKNEQAINPQPDPNNGEWTYDAVQDVWKRKD